MAALGEATETPERLWTAAMRANTADEVAHLALQAHAAQVSPHTWAARYNTWLLSKLTPKGIVFSFLFSQP